MKKVKTSGFTTCRYRPEVIALIKRFGFGLATRRCPKCGREIGRAHRKRELARQRAR